MDELAAWCAKLGIDVPPIPEKFRPIVRRQAEHLYGTLLTPLSMYDAQHWAFSDRLPDFVAVGHGGHGVNSYVLGYALGLESLRLVVQVGYGGAYMDHAESQQAVSEAFAATGRVIDAWERAGRPRLSIAAMDFYDSEWTLEGVKHTTGRPSACLEEVLLALAR